MPRILGLGLGASLLATAACYPTTPNSAVKIVGGSNVAAGATGPERLATVKVKTPNGDCTGTIIAKNLVLTAAHCVDGVLNSGDVIFGLDSNNPDKIIAIAASQTHPQYVGTAPAGSASTVNDVAIIKLAEDIPVNYQAIKLFQGALTVGTPGRQAGYGKSETGDDGLLKTVDTTVVKFDTANNYKTANGSTAACFGDSGGPLYVLKDDAWVMAAVASTANGTHCSGGNTYARIDVNYDFISAKAADLSGYSLPFAGVEAIANTGN